MAEKAHAMIDGLDEPQLGVEVLDRSGRVVPNWDGFGEGVAATAAAVAPAPVPSDAQAALLGTTATWTGRGAGRRSGGGTRLRGRRRPAPTGPHQPRRQRGQVHGAWWFGAGLGSAGDGCELTICF